jgi:hypothetical protein
MLHPAFGVMSREELVFLLGNAQTGEIRELQVLSSLPNLRESELPLIWHSNDKPLAFFTQVDYFGIERNWIWERGFVTPVLETAH